MSQKATQQGQLESATSVKHERDKFDGRERWKIFFQGDGGLELFATALRNDVANILTDNDELLVSVAEENSAGLGSS